VIARSLPRARLTTADGSVVCPRCELADRPLSRLRGLLGRRGLAAGEGMLIRPAPSVHTLFMRFPVDVVFLDRSLTVVKVVHGLRAWRAAGARKAAAALELPAGAAATAGVRAGDVLVLTPWESRSEVPG
jgi:uncharacterized protein